MNLGVKCLSQREETVRKDIPLGLLRTLLEIDRRVFIDALQIIHLGLAFTMRLSMIPT